jgi:imidazolonepropionase
VATAGAELELEAIAATALVHARVMTCAGADADPLGLVDDGALLVAGGRVAWVGASADVESAARAHGLVISVTRELDGRLLTPGLVDCHTHAIFAGDRAGEFALRARGAGYLEIAAAGGGIAATTGPTRAASDDALVALLLERVAHARSTGTTTIEVKSGYDLRVDGELRLLRLIARAAASAPSAIVPTLLCHLVPAERRGERAAYVSELVNELVPAVARERLATAVDVYCDDGAFTRDETAAILAAAKACGLAVRGHVGQFTDQGAAELIGSLAGTSVDHLEQVSAEAIAALARAGTIAVMLPGACVQLRLPPPPVAALRAAGVRMAIASDLNPGSSFASSLPLQLWLATTHLGMTVDEAWLGVTRHGAAALGLAADRGALAVGMRADVVSWDADHPAAVPYRYDRNLVHEVTTSW